VLRVKCVKCGRCGRYRVIKLAEQIGWDGKLTDWLNSLTKDCPRTRYIRMRASRVGLRFFRRGLTTPR
jgi:hypothetical protein